MKLTDAALRNIKPGKRDIWLVEDGRRGDPRLAGRITPSGARLFYLRYTNSLGKREWLPLGPYDREGKAGLTLKAAGEKAAALKLLYQSGIKDLKAHLAREERRQREEAERRRTGTFGELLDGYIATLDGRPSQKDCANTIKNHVRLAFPELCRLPASEITPSDIRDILARLIGQGKGRTAAKLRSHLLAAFNQAMRAAFDPTIPVRSGAFLIESNPVAAVPALTQFMSAGDRVLTWDELDTYHRALLPHQGSAVHDALLVALYLGGQRIAQVLRLTPDRVDFDGGTVTLFDPKGRRRMPRAHILPITPPVRDILARRLAIGDAWLFSATGKTPVHASNPGKIVSAISGGAYNLRDIRRTCETRLAEMGIHKDLRAQIQSHGLGGVQDRHYDRHDYLPEKRRALEAWAARLRGETGEAVVIPFQPGR